MQTNLYRLEYIFQITVSDFFHRQCFCTPDDLKSNVREVINYNKYKR